MPVTAVTDRPFSELLSRLLDGHGLDTAEARGLFAQLFDGGLDDGKAAALLIALRMKGESASEVAAAAEALRTRMTPFPVCSSDVLDTCGTGGDGSGTFNISTAVAFVAAGAGIRVVKHGNRAASGRTGSADVLQELGICADAGISWAARCLSEVGLAFCFAPHFHPALTRLAELRRRLGVRTILNTLGPLANPARARYQLIGVGRPELLDPLAGALSVLGTRHAILVSAVDGLDEVSLGGATQFRDVREGLVTAGKWTAEDFGLESCAVAGLAAADAAASAAIIRNVLADRPGPARRVVVANAAAALLAADQVATLSEGVARADAAICSGRAHDVLERLRAVPAAAG
jgi:anthranilate phosphoribosyltransferase